ncbi:GYDIA family GHMP kinase [Psychroserpens algicola]|uniref:GYDIA family GHMP kinase n=1 Tax=Psychroserpens algicola TaxID=1719034 RepID=A0ABT0H811_9FLAO|nr:GYDIA family GHMP kinase [Psychroserpens algicola]MCK8480498.1 GYDIA family GHMP kinase [Psychroserpens algicola]
MKRFYSHGKLLITGEYVVLDGAKALAVPTVYGQSLIVEKGDKGKLKWQSLDDNNTIWFEAAFDIQSHNILESIAFKSEQQTEVNHSIVERLLQILNAAKHLNPEFLTTGGYSVTTALEFPKFWGLGTSSTLINNIANWANVNPYQLLEATFGGSGYDIACASANSSLTYQLHTIHSDETLKPVQGDEQRSIKAVDFNPSFKNHIYFVHLNQKQNSREGIAQYRANHSNVSASVTTINAITEQMLTCHSLTAFQKLMDTHEQLISDLIKIPPIKTLLFNDFKGSIKSLGAWGGDFVMVACHENPSSYFASKCYHTILTYSEMVKN